MERSREHAELRGRTRNTFSLMQEPITEQWVGPNVSTFSSLTAYMFLSLLLCHIMSCYDQMLVYHATKHVCVRVCVCLQIIELQAPLIRI